MRSCDGRFASLTRPGTGMLVVLLLLASGCSRAEEKPVPGTEPLACEGQPDESSASSRPVSDVRRAAEGGPLFAQLAASSSLASCRVTLETSRIVLEHTFTNGATLRTTWDPRIEYGDQEARFAKPVPEGDALTTLKQIEAAAFNGGCGIDWSRPSTEDQAEQVSRREAVFRGETCNCRARLIRGPDARVVVLSFRSAC